MPAFILVLLEWLGPVLLSTLGRFVAALGIGVISYTGVSALTDQLFNYINTQMSGLPVVAAQFVAMFHMMTAANIVLSAYAGKFAIEGLKKFVVK